jgi:secreted trypsin-like serine protease
VKTVVAIMLDNVPVCSGTLIGDKWVVTAGHCFPDATLADMTVVAGEMDLGNYRFSTTAKTVGLKDVYLAKNYHYIPKKVLDFDLALVELAESLEVSKDDTIEAAALPPPWMKITGKEFQVVGWGHLGQFSARSPTLLSIDITVNQDQDCSATHGQTKYFPSKMFCGGSKSKTTCNGDSGGGAIFHGWGVPVVLGVVSFGKNTCNSSTVYTKIDAFLPWIFQVTNIR